MRKRTGRAAPDCRPANTACALLSGFYDDLVCQGTRIVVKGVDVLVDLPCSGAQALLLGLLGFSIAAAFCRARPLAAVTGLAHLPCYLTFEPFWPHLEVQVKVFS